MTNDEIIYYLKNCLDRISHPNIEKCWPEIFDDEVRFYFKLDKDIDYNHFFAMKRNQVEKELQAGYLMNSIVMGLRQIYLPIEGIDITQLEISR